MWSAAVLPGVIALMEAPTGLADPDHPPFTSVFIGLPAGQVGELLLERPGVVLRLHLVTSEIEALSVVLPLDALFEVRVQAALRLWRALMGRRSGPDPATLSPDRVTRLILALRTLDGLDAGATQHEIAFVLFGQKVSSRDWLSHDLHFRMKRLVRFARVLTEGGYRRLLLHPFRGR
ncbi:hypothetical protein AA12717_0670 [Gluconacetobacter sacchari DSM 12717]|uniref:T6SS Transcription factor RovC-like DNA binding domain-containing protein n=1 Tax=Gluconacetobacter sacchari DSM 12717 TaxID=1307940 RepID=A0ABQ0P4B5_9PROT|nr:hypothetical protein AA12717_0670 [Gluconacetobacter sacchari DSM 12717]